jgi:tetratricopeptide (TPR) repeat protein
MKSSGSLVKSTKNNMLSENKSLSNNNTNNTNSLMVKKSLIDYRKEYQEIIQKGKDEKNRIRFLNNSLQIRPYDISIINKLIDLAYSRQDDIAAVLAINKLLNLDKCTSKHYLMLGKIYFRRWYKDCSIDALYKSCEYYHTAMKYPDFHRKECLSSPIHYFEMFSILVRLGHYQQSLDILGIIVVHYKDFIEWNYLVQYNIAQVLLLLGNIKKSILLYQQLLLSPLIVEIDLSEHIDHVYYNTKRIVNVYLTLEYAHLLHITGNIKLSKQLYSETFDRMTKYNFNNTTNNVIDFRFTCSKFDQW